MTKGICRQMPHTPQKSAHPTWRATVLTLFPEMFPGPLGHSLLGQALEAKLWSLSSVPLRDYGTGRHRSVDDTPAGGGAGMVMRADVLAPAIDNAREANPDAPAIYLSPRGEPLTQRLAHNLAQGPGVILVAGRFEGIDERVIEGRGLREVSVGDYVLSGGDIPAMILLDACVRLLPGVVGAPESLEHESFENGLLEYPHYTKPRIWEDREIPSILLSGNHKEIERWRRDQSMKLTRERRPDLLSKPTHKREK